MIKVKASVLTKTKNMDQLWGKPVSVVMAFVWNNVQKGFGGSSNVHMNTSTQSFPLKHFAAAIINVRHLICQRI